MQYVKASSWKGQDLKGDWLFTYKIDGVRALLNSDGDIVSRANKPLYNLNHLKEIIRDHEIYLGTWEASVSAVRTINGEPVSASCVYDLRADHIDSRLVIGSFNNPTALTINHYLRCATEAGFEGLVLRSPQNNWLRVKPKETHDVYVTDIVEGTGRNKGRLGALITTRGKVGVGFNDAQRVEFFEGRAALIGAIVEVECLSIHKSGKFRDPRFIRIRPDKTNESVIL